MKKALSVILTVVLLSLVHATNAFAPSIGSGSIGQIFTTVGLPQVSSQTVTATDIYYHNLWYDGDVSGTVVTAQTVTGTDVWATNLWDENGVGFLKLDCSNDPLTDSLLIAKSTDRYFTALTLQNTHSAASNAVRLYMTNDDRSWYFDADSVNNIFEFWDGSAGTLVFSCDYSGNISFDNNRLETTGSIYVDSDSSVMGFGAASPATPDATIGFDGDSLNIIANAVTAGNNLEITANLVDLGATPITTTGIGDFGSLVTPYTKTLSISPAGGDYTTIQAALDANTAGGELFLVYPGTYTDDTIAFTANNQTVRGMGIAPANVLVTTASSNICDYSTYTGCKVNRIKMAVTAATTLVNTVQGSSGSCNFVKCHTSMTTTYATAGQQPCCFGSTGNGTVKISEGTVEYNHSGSNAAILKAAICWAANTPTYALSDCTIDVNGSNASTAITTGYGTGAATVSATRTDADITDTSSGIVAGWYIGGTGDGEFYYNTLHVNGGSTVAIGVYILSTPTIRGMFNHIHVKDSTANYSYWTAGNCTLTTQFEDIIAADGINNTGGATIVHCHSEADGDFDATGTITAEQLTSTDDITMQGHLLTLGNGSAADVVVDFSGNTSSGQFSWDESEDYFSYADMVLFNAHVGIGNAAIPDANNVLKIAENGTDITSNLLGIRLTVSNTSTASNSKKYFAFRADAIQASDQNMTNTQALMGFLGGGTIQNTGDVEGGQGLTGSLNISAGITSGTITSWKSMRAQASAAASATGNVDNMYLIQVADPTGTWNITNMNGLHIADITQGTNIYPLWMEGDGTGGKIFQGGGKDVSVCFDGADWIFNSENITANDEIHFTNFDAYSFDAPVIFTQADGNEFIDSQNDGYLDLGATTAIRTEAVVIAEDAIYFTQTDGAEKIDSAADGYIDYTAGTGHRFNVDVYLGADADVDHALVFGGDTSNPTIYGAEDHNAIGIMDDEGDQLIMKVYQDPDFDDDDFITFPDGTCGHGVCQCGVSGDQEGGSFAWHDDAGQILGGSTDFTTAVVDGKLCLNDGGDSTILKNTDGDNRQMTCTIWFYEL